jgi:NodT family efflux transporter outer membrane factor (OMF) lipoprotein
MKNLLCRMLLAGSIVLGGCGSLLQTPWQAPDVTVPAKWQMVTDPSVKGSESWWKNFNDPQLDTLVDQALRTNNDFAAAAIRVRRAQLRAGLTDTNRTPSASVGLNTGVTRTFKPDANYRSSGSTSMLSFEVDLWGKLAREREAAHLEAQATESDCRAYALSLIGTATRLYWQVAYLNQSLTLNAADVDYAEKMLAVSKAKHTAGAVSALDVAQAETNLATQQAFRTQLIQQRFEARNALAILLNQPPESDVVDPLRLSDTPMPGIAAGLPADILANRPDLHSAELRLREALANVDVARTSFYPTFSLTGSLGTSSATLVKLLQNPVARLGAGLSLPFIQWNTMQLSIRVSETQYEEAVVDYRQRLYTALAEVENTLSARTQLMVEEEKLRLAVEQAQRAESLAQFRFKSGFTDLQQWLFAQANLRSAERSLIVNRLNQLNNMANLYRSLGLGADQGSASCG